MNEKEQMTFQFADPGVQAGAKIKVVGVGGAGCNALNRMIEDGLSGVEFIAVNTDYQALVKSKAATRLQIGIDLTGGLGAGGKPDVGRASAEESRDEIRAALEGADMVFVTCGEGGGTGTGAAPVIAEIARELEALTVGVVTKPFRVEGGPRMRQAMEGIARLREHVDTLIVIPNQRLLALVEPNLPLRAALRKADEVLYQATKGIADLINVPGEINVDFADVRSVMLERGDALMGTGTASEEGRAEAAAQAAISSPLLEDVSIKGSKGVLVNVTGGPDLALTEVERAVEVVYEAAGHDANIILGTVIDENLGPEVRVTVIATGFNREEENVAAPATGGQTVRPWEEESPAGAGRGRDGGERRLRMVASAPPEAVRGPADPEAETGSRQPGRQAGERPGGESRVPDGVIVELPRRAPSRGPAGDPARVPEEIERPAYVRSRRTIRGLDGANPPGGGRASADYDKDDLEVPTYLRRQMD